MKSSFIRQVILQGAAVQPSGEDQLMFSIVPQQGDPYKLKGKFLKFGNYSTYNIRFHI